VVAELGQAGFEELAEDGHVDGECVHRVGEVAFGQDVVDEVDLVVGRKLELKIMRVKYCIRW